MSQVVFIPKVLLKPILCLFFLNFIYFNVNGQDYESVVGKSYGERQLFLLGKFYMNYDLRAESVKYYQEASKLLEVAEKANDKEIDIGSRFLEFQFFIFQKLS